MEEDVSWDTVMFAMGEEVSEEMFGAGDTVPQTIVQFTSDGNDKVYLVEVGEGFYRCQVQTS